MDTNNNYTLTAMSYHFVHRQISWLPYFASVRRGVSFQSSQNIPLSLYVVFTLLSEVKFRREFFHNEFNLCALLFVTHLQMMIEFFFTAVASNGIF